MSATRIPPVLRASIAERARHRCSYCQTAESVTGSLFTVDHVIPEALGGRTTAENLVCLLDAILKLFLCACLGNAIVSNAPGLPVASRSAVRCPDCYTPMRNVGTNTSHGRRVGLLSRRLDSQTGRATVSSAPSSTALPLVNARRCVDTGRLASACGIVVVQVIAVTHVVSVQTECPASNHHHIGFLDQQRFSAAHRRRWRLPARASARRRPRLPRAQRR